MHVRGHCELWDVLGGPRKDQIQPWVSHPFLPKVPEGDKCVQNDREGVRCCFIVSRAWAGTPVLFFAKAALDP